MPYILQSIFLLLAPILFAASLYMTLGRVIRSVDGHRFSMISPRWLTRIFVFGDLFSFLIQSSGAGLLVRGGDLNSKKMGENIIVGGLVFQIIIFAIFCFTAVFFNFKFRRHGASSLAQAIPWQSSLNMLYITSALVMLRNIFRVVQYVMGQNGFLMVNEWPVYVFDAVQMFLTMLWFLVRYPSQLHVTKGIETGTETEIELRDTTRLDRHSKIGSH